MKKRTKESMIFELIGRIIVYAVIWGLSVAGFVWAFCQNTIY